MPVLTSLGYTINIGQGTLSPLSAFLKKSNYTAYFIICDENTFQHCLPILIQACEKLSAAHIIELESGEASKSIEFTAHIWQTLLENKADKNALIINLGGGVVSDLGGFCASTYKRGIDFVNIPTSLLAMVDASVGGKTGIDFGAVKNSIGIFAQPKMVVINTKFLKTLPIRHYKNGLAEVFKIALICDKKFWEELKSNKNNIASLIYKSVALKNKHVLKDPYDKGVRKTLNFGHTLGHAIEALSLESLNTLLHGEAIVIGMIIESHIAFQKKMLSKKELEEIVLVLKSNFDVTKLISLHLDSILDLINNDKKTVNAKFKFALITKIGACTFDVTVTETQLKKAITFYKTI